MIKPLHIINALRESDFFIEHLFMNGSCYKFYLFLKSIYPDAIPYITESEDHIVTCINGKFYDIKGIADLDKLYRKLEQSDLNMVNGWSFRSNNLIKLHERPSCEEPLIYDPELEQF